MERGVKERYNKEKLLGYAITNKIPGQTSLEVYHLHFKEENIKLKQSSL